MFVSYSMPQLCPSRLDSVYFTSGYMWEWGGGSFSIIGGTSGHTAMCLTCSWSPVINLDSSHVLIL